MQQVDGGGTDGDEGDVDPGSDLQSVHSVFRAVLHLSRESSCNVMVHYRRYLPKQISQRPFTQSQWLRCVTRFVGAALSRSDRINLINEAQRKIWRIFVGGRGFKSYTTVAIPG